MLPRQCSVSRHITKDMCSSLIAVNNAVSGNLETVVTIKNTFRMALGDQNHTTPISVMLHTRNESPTSVTEQPSVTLPPEVWSIIIGNLDGPSQNELAFLWMTVRNVSKSIRNEVERVFRKEHIRKTKLICDCGMSSSHQVVMQWPSESIP